MKKLLLVIVGFFFVSTLAISGDIPAAVQKAFEQRFPKVKSVKWEIDKAPVYEGSFKLDGVKYSASFNETGEWLETITMLAFAQLPIEVKKAYNTTYSVGTAESVSKIETSDGSTKFRMKFKRGLYGFVKVEVFYLPDGTEME
jgi:Putative beta-lactamase-inhibitor-like, PepSY-like